MHNYHQHLLLTVGLWAFGSGAFAAENVEVASIETVTVTATRNPMSTIVYPGMVDVLGQDEIDALIPSTISDLVEDMPNVEFTGGPRRTGEGPAIRGFDGQDVLILVDGVRQSWASGHDGRFFLDPSLLVSADMVRGPNSALYGSGALGGVMAFRTAEASDLLEKGQNIGVRGTFGFQGVDDEFVRTVTGFGRAGKFDFIASLGQRTSGDISLGDGTSLAADDDILTGFAKARYDDGAGFSAQVSYQGFRDGAVEPNNGQGVTTSDPLDKTVVAQTFAAQINWKPVGQRWIDLHLTPYHTQGAVKEEDPSSGEIENRDIKTDGFSIDNRTAFSFENVAGLVTVGGEWYRNEQVGTNTASADGTRAGVPDGEDSFWGAFVQVEATVDRPFGAPGKLTLVPALRYDSYHTASSVSSDLDKDMLSPKFAATYAPVEWAFVFGNVGKAFRAPGLNELYLDGVHFTVSHPILGSAYAVANTFVPNPDLKPQTSEYWEVGGGLIFDDLLVDKDALRIKGSYWRQSVDDYIELAVSVPPTFYSIGCFTYPFTVGCNVGTTTAANVDAELQGAEVEAQYDLGRWRWRFAYGASTGTEKDSGDDLSLLMPARYTSTLTARIPEIDASVNARIEIAQAIHTTEDSRAGYTVFDVYATWAPGDAVFGGALKGFRLNAGIDNVFDEDYEPYQSGVPARGRNVKLLASYTIGW